MKEKKKFILAIPTIIIIIVSVIGISLIFYNRNVKAMTREEVRLIAQKVATIDNISCEIVTESNVRNEGKSVVDYKLKNKKMVSKTDYYTIYDDEKTKIQIDDNEKVAYVYDQYDSEILYFQEMLCTVEKMLENDEYKYEFNSYETMNGIKCIAFKLTNGDSSFDVWLDKSNGMIVKIACHYYADGLDSIDTLMYYRYQIGQVTDKDVSKPDLTDYSVVEM